LRQEYGYRRDTMLRALRHYFPAEARWTEPDGGMFIWVSLPEEVNTTELLSMAVEAEKVAFIPGQAFVSVANCHASHCMRLNFSNCAPPQIEEGIKRLARVLPGNISCRSIGKEFSMSGTYHNK
jgi:2-aminoadipate transaminase